MLLAKDQVVISDMPQEGLLWSVYFPRTHKKSVRGNTSIE